MRRNAFQLLHPKRAGLQTQAAIRQYQATKNLPQDGYVSRCLYQQLL